MRPVLRWHGGKWRLAPWIIAHFPKHRVYVEPFGGAASVLLRKPRAYAEVYNDLDGEAVNLFRVLRGQGAAALVKQLRLTPFARAEFEQAYIATAEPIERARRLIVRSFMGFGSNGLNKLLRTGFRAASNRSSTIPAHDWVNYPDSLAAVVDRLAGVVIENRDAVNVMRQHDGAKTLHYVDPPYMLETRSNKSRCGKSRYHAYSHELTREDHGRLLADLATLDGMVVLSGYPAPLYDGALASWRRCEIDAYADGARPRRECLWLNPACVEALGHGPLFDAPGMRAVAVSTFMDAR